MFIRHTMFAPQASCQLQKVARPGQFACKHLRTNGTQDGRFKVQEFVARLLPYKGFRAAQAVSRNI